MIKLLKYGLILSSMAVMLLNASQARAVSITDDLESNHTFYITSEWATGDHWSVTQNQDFSDLLNEMQTDFRLDSVNLEVFYVGDLQEGDLPAGLGSSGDSSAGSGATSQGSGSGSVSSQGGSGSGGISLLSAIEDGSFDSQENDRDCDPEKEACSEGPDGENDPQDQLWSSDPDDYWPPPDDQQPGFLPKVDDQYCPPDYDYNRGPAPVPEPATLLLMGGGLAVLAGRRLRRKQPQA